MIVIAGPTASGKTSLGIDLAKHWDTCILSADSRQFYQEMTIGTAKPSTEELAAAPHHFINHLSIHDAYSVGDFEREAIALLDAIYQQKDVALLVGGSGLFVKAVLQGLDEFPEVPEPIRQQFMALHQREGIAALQKMLQEKDPVYHQQVDLQNPHRLLRALSVIAASGLPFSHFRAGTSKQRAFQPIIIHLGWEREALYARINQRVERMMEQGLLAEAAALFPHRHLKPLRTVGYQELFDQMEGRTSLAEAFALIQRNSRRYAKRQLTWLRDTPGAATFHPSQQAEIIAYIENQMRP